MCVGKQAGSPAGQHGGADSRLGDMHDVLFSTLGMAPVYCTCFASSHIFNVRNVGVGEMQSGRQPLTCLEEKKE